MDINTDNLDWFDIRKYEILDTFDLKDWYIQLDIRQTIKSYNSREENDSYFNSLNGSVQEYVDLIKKSPIVPRQQDISRVKSVRYAEYYDLYMAASYNTDLEKFFSVPLLEIGGSETLIIDQAKHGYAEAAMLSIDLDATDEQLKEDFSSWLIEQRNIYGKAFRKKKL